MAKIPKADEPMIWATAYSVAAALLTLGTSIKGGTFGADPREIDDRAASIADAATKRLKGKLK